MSRLVLVSWILFFGLRIIAKIITLFIIIKVDDYRNIFFRIFRPYYYINHIILSGENIEIGVPLFSFLIYPLFFSSFIRCFNISSLSRTQKVIWIQNFRFLGLRLGFFNPRILRATGLVQASMHWLTSTITTLIYIATSS